MSAPYRSREEVRQLLKALHDSGELEAMIQEATAATSEVTHGTMSDGAKRRLVPSSVVPSEELDQFEVIALHQEMCHQSAKQDQEPVPPSKTALKTGYRSSPPTLPEGVTSVAEWGKTICELTKVAKRGITYAAMLEESKKSKEMRDYLQWINTAGVKSAKVDDLRGYMTAVGFNVPCSTYTVTYPGSSEPRRFGS